MQLFSGSRPTSPSVHPYDGVERTENLFCSYTEHNGKTTKILQPFSSQEMDSRLAKVRGLMASRRLEVLILSSPESIYYLSNYQTPGNPLTVLVVPLDPQDGLVLFTRELEASNMHFRGTHPCRVYGEGEDQEQVIAEHVARLPRRHGPGYAIGFEANSARLTVNSQRNLEAQVERLRAADDPVASPSREWLDASDMMVKIRNVKSEQEVAYSRKAAHYTLAGIRAAVQAMRPGATEVEVAGEALRAMGEAGHEYASYPVFLAFGNAGCIAHHAASRRTLNEGELVFIEIGGCCHRYHASKMHTVWIGNEPPDWYLEAEALLKQATAAGRAAAVNGSVAKEVDAAMRSVVSRLSMPHWMSRRSAYAIGTGLATDWAEKNILVDAKSEAVLASRMTLHLVPWIQIEGIGSMGFSDTIIVQPSGPAMSLFEAEPPRFYEQTVRVLREPSLSRAVNVDKGAMAAAQAFHSKSVTCTPLKTVKLGVGKPTVHLKDESARCGLRASKVLGVTYAIARMFERGELQRGDTVASTTTDGNHGEALAVVAAQQGLSCVVLVPQNVCSHRIAVLHGLGAEVREVHNTCNDCVTALRRDAKLEGWKLVCDTSWDGYETIPTDIVHGYTHIFHEALEELTEPPTHVLIQAGAGGLLAAGAAYMSAHYPSTRVVSVEPADAGCILENAKAGRSATKLVECEGAAGSNMQGLNCSVPSPVVWPLIVSHTSDYLAIGDEWARKATRELYHKHGYSVSESGAAAYAGVLAAQTIDGKLGINEHARVLVILTEGVTNPESFNKTVGQGAYELTAEDVIGTIRERYGLDSPGSCAVEPAQRADPTKLDVKAKSGPPMAKRPSRGLLSRLSKLFPSTESLHSSTDSLPSFSESVDSDDDSHPLGLHKGAAPTAASRMAAAKAMPGRSNVTILTVDLK